MAVSEKKYYFLGIGGSAMASVAGALKMSGIPVVGSDSGIYPPMSDFLRKYEIPCFQPYTEQNLVQAKPDVVVVGNAISRGNPELEYALEQNLELISMPDLISRLLIARSRSVVIAGTHGKTTTASLTAWLLESAGLAPGFLIGGIPGNFSFGARPIPDHFSENGNDIPYFVIEGDEYDSAFFDKRSKFLHYKPHIAVVNNIEFDHADIFGSIDDILRSFHLFARLVPRNGLILAPYFDATARKALETTFCSSETFGVESGAFWRVSDSEYFSGGTSFTLLRGEKEVGRFVSGLSGEHNVRNTIAALAVGTRIGISPERLQKGLETFVLPRRRMEEVGLWNGALVIDDFGHHPTAIAETLKAIRQKYPSRRIIACFEPRSNTTTRNFFQKELTECFHLAELVVIGAVNRPERYDESERLNTTKIVADLTAQGKTAFAVSVDDAKNPRWGEKIAAFLSEKIRENDVLVLLSNGDFGGLRAIVSATVKK